MWCRSTREKSCGGAWRIKSAAPTRSAPCALPRGPESGNSGRREDGDLAYVDPSGSPLTASPNRLLIGVLASFLAPAAITVPFLPPEIFALLLLAGLGSVLVVYMPLISWRLPRSRHPLFTCIWLGGIAAPGPFGMLLALTMLVTTGAPLAALSVLAAMAPFGLLGGFVFWLCVVWRNPEFHAVGAGVGRPT